MLKRRRNSAGASAFCDVFETAGFLEERRVPTFLDLPARLQEQRRARLQNIFRASKTFRKGQQFLNAGHILDRVDRPAGTPFGAHRAAYRYCTKLVGLLTIAAGLQVRRARARPNPSSARQIFRAGGRETMKPSIAYSLVRPLLRSRVRLRAIQTLDFWLGSRAARQRRGRAGRIPWRERRAGWH